MRQSPTSAVCILELPLLFFSLCWLLSFFFFVFFLLLTPSLRPALIHRVASHGVPAAGQVIYREEGADWRRAAHPGRLGAAGAPPQATGIVGPAPERGAVEVAAVPLAGVGGGGRAAGEGVRLIHPALGGANGLPARGGSGQWLPLCKETVYFLLAGKLGQNSSVSQNTPATQGERTFACDTSGNLPRWHVGFCDILANRNWRPVGNALYSQEKMSINWGLRREFSSGQAYSGILLVCLHVHECTLCHQNKQNEPINLLVDWPID